MTEDSKTHFLNVDLDLRASKDLSALVQALEPDVMTLTCTAVEDGYLASVELATDPVDADSAIRRFVALIEKLPWDARALWNEARRDFSIGVQAGTAPTSFELALTPTTLGLAAEVGARITFVVYVDAEPSPEPSPSGNIPVTNRRT